MRFSNRLVIAGVAAALVAGALVASATSSAPPKPSLVALRPVATWLADDERQGRLPGSQHERDSARYIADLFTTLGLRPLVGERLVHPFDFDTDAGTVRSAGNVVSVWDVGAEDTLVLGAHYDHLGRGPRFSKNPFVDEVHNGADDNASGVAVLLRLADRYASGARTSKVNLVFVAFSGEEAGLFGSKAFLAQLAPPQLAQVRGMLNFDMVGRRDARTPMLTLEGPQEFPGWNTLLAGIDPRGFTLRTSEPLTPGSSDHETFALADVPVLSFSTGRSPGYHLPTDDVQFLDFEGMEAVVSIALDVVDAVARDPAALTARRPHPVQAPGALPLP